MYGKKVLSEDLRNWDFSCPDLVRISKDNWYSSDDSGMVGHSVIEGLCQREAHVPILLRFFKLLGIH